MRRQDDKIANRVNKFVDIYPQDGIRLCKFSTGLGVREVIFVNARISGTQKAAAREGAAQYIPLPGSSLPDNYRIRVREYERTCG